MEPVKFVGMNTNYVADGCGKTGPGQDSAWEKGSVRKKSPFPERFPEGGVSVVCRKELVCAAFSCSNLSHDINRKADIPNGISAFLVRRKGLEPPTY